MVLGPNYIFDGPGPLTSSYGYDVDIEQLTDGVDALISDPAGTAISLSGTIVPNCGMVYVENDVDQ